MPKYKGINNKSDVDILYELILLEKYLPNNKKLVLRDNICLLKSIFDELRKLGLKISFEAVEINKH